MFQLLFLLRKGQKQHAIFLEHVCNINPMFRLYKYACANSKVKLSKEIQMHSNELRFEHVFTCLSIGV